MTLQPKDLETFLHLNIPITEKMQISVLEITAQSVCMGARLLPNQNDKQIAFAGSMQSLMTICGWGMVFSLLYGIDEEVQLFIRRNSVAFNKPVDSDFTAVCRIDDKNEIERFQTAYREDHKARLVVKVILYNKQEEAATFEGEFVALRKKI